MRRARTIGTGAAGPRFGSVALGWLVAAAAAVLSAPPAWAQVCTDVTTQPVSFGSYDETSGSALDAQGQVRVVCDAGVGFEVRLGPGGNSSGTFSPRRMARVGGTYFLNYNLYLDSGRTQIWGDGTGATLTLTGTVQGSQSVHQIFGRVFALQPVGVGTYNDTVLVSVIF